MKSIVSFLLFFLINISGVFSQSIVPPGIPYQAIARNANGTPYTNASLSVRFSLHEQTATGAVSYVESQSLQTNDLGLFSTTFGNGTPITGTFAGINWAQTTKFLQVEINLGSAWVDLGTQQLMSVPYAMYAGNSQPGPQGPQGPAGSQGSTGATGTGITSTQIANDSLIVTYSNSQTQNAGKVKTSYIAGNGIVISGDTISSTNNSIVGTTPNRRIVLNSSTTWTCPSGVTQILVEVWGAGGGGGGTIRSNLNGSYNPCVYTAIGVGGTGGKGGYNMGIINVVPGQTYNITIGQGGIGAQKLNLWTGQLVCATQYGGNGGSSSFNGLVNATGGTGGGPGCARVNSPCLQETGPAGLDGSVINYHYIPAPPTRSYLPANYIPSPPGCCASGGAGAVDPPSSESGENGLVVISY